MEAHFQKKSENIFTSETGRPCFVFVDDLHLAAPGPSPLGALRALAKYGGWFSQPRRSYIHFERTQVGCAFTCSSKTNSAKHSYWTDGWAELPESVVEHFVVLGLPELDIQHLTSIFTEIVA